MEKYLTPEVVGLAGQIITFLGIAITAFVTYRNRRAIQELHISLNSRLSELIEAQRKVAYADGVAAERQATTEGTKNAN